MNPKTVERVSDLEKIVKDLAYAQMKTEMNLNSFIEEMRAFKNEMKVFKDEMGAFKDEMKDEVKRVNKQWGELANKMGTVVEDIVAPNISRIAREHFDCKELEDFMIRRRVVNKKDTSKIREFDVIAKWKNTVIINETKATVRVDYINDFIEVLNEVFSYFPEYKGMKVIPIFSSLNISDEQVSYLTKNKIYAMAMKDDTMVVLNPELSL